MPEERATARESQSRVSPGVNRLGTYRHAPVQIRTQQSFEAFVRFPPQSHRHLRAVHA